MIEFDNKEWCFGEINKAMYCRLDQNHFSVRYAMKAKVTVRDIKSVVYITHRRIWERTLTKLYILKVIVVLFRNSLHFFAELFKPIPNADNGWADLLIFLGSGIMSNRH